MLTLQRPSGARTPEPVELAPLPATLVVGRLQLTPDGGASIALDGDARCSRRHGVFAVDSAGTVRYLDLDSTHGSLLVPLNGQPRRIQPRRPIALWPGDAIAIGGPLPTAPTAAHVRRCMNVFRVEPGAPTAVPFGSPAPSHPVLEALSCTVCHEPLRRPGSMQTYAE